ncbi:MAG: hypothetical protein M3R09_00060, partial [Actinomycetota bacterium]|nr:hypothetical protein [Actinomycetota bacterium]
VLVLGRPVASSLSVAYRIHLLPHLLRSAGSGLTVELLNLQGTRLAWVKQRKGLEVDMALNEQSSAAVQISLEDVEALQVAPLSRLLRIRLDDEPLFTGYVVTTGYSSETNSVALRAFDPFWRLKERAAIGMRGDNTPLVGAGQPGYVRGRPYRVAGIDQSEIMWLLVSHAEITNGERAAGVPSLGVKKGIFYRDAVKLRDREYEWGKTIGEAILDMTTVRRGPDFAFRPLLNSELGYWGYQHWAFDTFKPGRGTDRTSNVIFEHNTGRNNAPSFHYEPDGLPVANRSMWQGQAIEGLGPPQVTRNQPESQLAYGIYGDVHASTEIIYTETLREHADEFVAAHAWPPNFFDMTIAQADGSGWRRDPQTGELVRAGRDFGQPFIFGPDPGGKHDFGLGDTIRGIARFGKLPDGTFALYEDLAGRVTDAKITEVENMNAHVVEIKAAPTIDYSGVV